MSNIYIKYAKTDDERDRIYDFRYAFYNKAGKTISDADHERQQIKDSMDQTSVLLYAEAEGEVVATLRTNQGLDADALSRYREIYDLDNFEDFLPDHISLSSKTLVEQEWRDSKALSMLLIEFYNFGREKGIKFDFRNCSPDAIEFYEHMGYLRYRDGSLDEDMGYRVPMVLVLDDAQHLKKVRSPLYNTALYFQGKDDASGKAWFDEHIEPESEYVNRRLVSVNDFWALLETKLSASLSKVSPLFEGLTDNEVQNFLGMSTIIKCQKSDPIIRPGDIGEEMFIILSGIAEVKTSLEDDAISLALLSNGQIFGEMAFVSHAPRSAAVIAKTNLELLVLSQSLFHETMKSLPEITAKVLLNLSNILCKRLQMSTDNLRKKE